MNLVKIGAFITTERKAKGLTQKELAEKLCVTDSAVSKWERGNSLPDITLMKPLCEILSITLNELLEGERISEQETAMRAEKQIEKQLVEKKVLTKRAWLMTAAAVLAILVVVPLMIIGQFSNESTVRKLFNILCIIVPIFCIVIATGLYRNKPSTRKPGSWFGEIVLIIGVLLILTAGVLLIFDNIERSAPITLFLIGLILEGAGLGIKKTIKRN